MEALFFAFVIMLHKKRAMTLSHHRSFDSTLIQGQLLLIMRHHDLHIFGSAQAVHIHCGDTDCIYASIASA